MEGNRDESEKCYKVAEKSMLSGDIEKAIKFLNKAEKLFPSQKSKDLLSKLSNPQASAAAGPEDTHSGNNNGSGASGGGEGPRRRQANAAAGAAESHMDYTPEQAELAKKIRKCKDYYEILGVSKEQCGEDDLKKAYRKLALKLHPDKNNAPGSTEAFKAVGNAFAVLNDPEKRRRYDQFGADGPEVSHRHSHEHSGYSRGFEGDISAEELFNMFFGGAFPSGQMHTRRMFRRGQQPQQGGVQTENSYTLLLQLAPILFLVFLSLISSFLVSEPVYSLQRTDRYAYHRKTEHLHVPYFVKSDFHQEYKGSLRRLEQHVEDDYVSNLRSNCFKERSYKENMLWRARNFNDARLYDKAVNLKTPSCDTLQSLYS